MNMIRNSLGRDVPREVSGLGIMAPFQGAWARVDSGYEEERRGAPLKGFPPVGSKVKDDMKKVIEASGLEDGMTVSFHHHLRNGDAVLPAVMAAIEEMGIKDLAIASSSLTAAHDCVADYVRKGVVTRIFTSGARGEVGKCISAGELDIPVVIRSHGGRARAIEEGSISIDVAFLGAPACDRYGNMTGAIGQSGCGSLGYAKIDAAYARHVVAVTDNLVDAPLTHVSIPQYLVDQVLLVESLGDPSKIASGAARITRSPVDLKVAENAYELVLASGLLRPGVSFQVGAGGASLAVAAFVRDYMREKKIKGSWGCGGITGYMVSMLEEGLFDGLFDVQSFDAAVRDSLFKNPRHVEIDASWYANPFNKGCVVNDLDVVVLAALDVDTDFNVNVMTGNNGELRGASGGHCDTAAGAKLTVVVAPSFRGGIPTIKDEVQTVVTPGETVDAVVTERGICINPRRKDLLEAARRARLNVKDIHDLKTEVEKMTGIPSKPDFDRSKVVALVEYRDGTIIDSIYKLRS
ncbi:citrate lyase subunit alpha [Dethiosulfovibrio sp. F2B]|uniref:citrate lyase subunit alpha n=1 Tax=Dethiosulfovibrio faecalis TaxID=2720018 RepID=UPI001F3086F9|nr:citrate lyase subunit alpha [Dethiosulfovibrio faecalis]MCF4150799.1 citrate lyase subunit alpha [Dethiosulfovibrio faecalis]